MEHIYKLQYEVNTKAGLFSAAELKEAGKGGTDGLILISCIEAEDGSYSQTHMSKDGNRGGESMSTIQEAKAWNLMGAALLRRPDLRPDFRVAIEASLDIIRAAMGIPPQGGPKRSRN